MNRKQKVAVLVGALVVTLVAMFPPWTVRDFRERSPLSGTAMRSNTYFHSFRWIGSEPVPDESLAGSRPNFEAALTLQLATLALTVAAVVVLKERKP